jgi:hypothetical protein
MHAPLQAFHKDQATVKRIQRALPHAASWGNAGKDFVAGAVDSIQADSRGASAAAAALFAALHKHGARDWVIGGGRGIEDADIAARRAASGALSSAGCSRRASRSSSAHLAQSMQGGRRASRASAAESSSDGIEGMQELLGTAEGSEGPLSRSLSVSRQKSAAAMEAAQLVGGALGQVPEGDREGAGASGWI